MSPEPSALFLGVDGGGTRCRARLADAQGRPLGEGVSGPANARRGAGAAISACVEAARAALANAGLDQDAFGRVHAGLGLAGVCQSAGREAALAEPHPFASRALTTDFAIACLGAHGGGDGGVVIVGTGSVAYARTGDHEIRIGGWGFEASDDGGGAPLGREALRHALRAADGLEPFGPLARDTLEAVGGDPEAAVAWVGAAGPAEFGTLAPKVVAHADADPAAAALLDEAAARVSALALRLAGWGAERVALAGGLAGVYAPRLSRDAQAVLATPLGDPLDGAVALALRSARP
ncbi:N-acetylglucosamine kinase [Methylopila jiangsuensis]|uniref:N-acetylglucosamine kinase n=1 Tax=Methylopila jiangsuensis TaxID=586230 RepID=A0A9W6N2V8_9HYPH|nr:BadF/BadG/BcrA/BcrD ATPase family protein [Methylopila jiangsuensis]MDR6285672.1 glucosamine kinase [Methylopila jiangsuensis]GLK75432.1 N-acetylglucosamine kinase [Methylopila jiangsuensis]